MIKYVNGKKVEYEETLPPDMEKTKNKISIPTEIERIETLEMAMLEIAEVLANG